MESLPSTNSLAVSEPCSAMAMAAYGFGGHVRLLDVELDDAAPYRVLQNGQRE